MQIGVDTSTAVDNKRLFIVDTDDITRMALQFMLHDENEAHDLPSLDAAFKKSEAWRPDLILLGTGVVQEMGLGVLGDIKSRMQGVRLLLVSDSADDALTKECLQSGADGLLLKPLTIEATRKKVDMLLGRRRKSIIPLHPI